MTEPPASSGPEPRSSALPGADDLLTDWARRRAARAGPEGTEWVATLPSTVERLARQWSLEFDAPYRGGSASFVAPARRGAHDTVVVKVPLSREGHDETVALLAAARGRGYVRLLDVDDASGSLLLEQLGEPLADVRADPDDQIDVLGTLLTTAWTAVTRPVVTASAARAKADQLAEMIEHDARVLDHGCPSRVIDEALRCAASRAAAARVERCVVVHGDPHPHNALAVLSPRDGADTGFVFVDPDGFAAEPEYDVGVVLRDWSYEVCEFGTGWLRERAGRLARATATDEDAVWEWAYLERVSTGLHILSFGADTLARPFLEAATRLASGL